MGMHYLIIIYYLIKNNIHTRVRTYMFLLILKNLILLKNINILQIYLYSINIYFKLGSSEFRSKFDNIYIFSIIH
jgi:hypothetical protein